MENLDRTGPKRQIGAIFIERGHISEEQLALALEQQQATGEKLGEILVANHGVSRLDLASALEEQWTQDGAGKIPNHSNGSSPASEDAHRDPPRLGEPPSELQDVRAQLDEVVMLGAVLKRTTDGLDSRLAAVETLLFALSAAIEELRHELTPGDSA